MFFNSDKVIAQLKGLIPLEQMPGEDIYCALTSALLSRDAGENLSLRLPREIIHCLGKKKKKRLIFYNKYHNDCSLFCHCIIHQGAFCSKISDILSCILCCLFLLSRLYSSTRACSFHNTLFKSFFRNLMSPMKICFCMIMWDYWVRREC